MDVPISWCEQWENRSKDDTFPKNMMKPLDFPLNWWIARCKGQFLAAVSRPNFFWQRLPLAKKTFQHLMQQMFWNIFGTIHHWFPGPILQYTDTRPTLTICFIKSSDCASWHGQRIPLEGPGQFPEVACEDFAFDMRDWPFEELDDLLRLSDEVLRVGKMEYSVLEGRLKQGFDMFQSWVITKTLSVSRRFLSNLMTNFMVFKDDQNYFL